MIRDFEASINIQVEEKTREWLMGLVKEYEVQVRYGDGAWWTLGDTPISFEAAKDLADVIKFIEDDAQVRVIKVVHEAK